MEVLVNGDYQLVELGLAKEIQDSKVTFVYDNKEVDILVDEETLDYIKDINNSSELALFPIDPVAKTVLLNNITSL